jgi:hypothetical protein
LWLKKAWRDKAQNEADDHECDAEKLFPSVHDVS